MPRPSPGGGDWRILLLSALNAPQSNLCIDALQWWADSEGMPAYANNWLATTEDGYGGVPYNSTGVKAYPTITDGVDATAATLGAGTYRNLVAALQSGTSLQDIWSEVNSSPWCAGCQAGLYPVVLFRHLGATPSPTPPSGPPPPPPPGPTPEQHAAVTAWGLVQDAMHPTANRQIGQLQAISNAVRQVRK